MRTNIITKITLLLSLMLLVGIANVGVVYFYQDQAKHDAHIVNVAGRQRMLSQEITRLVLSVSHGMAADRRRLTERIKDYDATLNAMTYGGEAMGEDIPVTPIMEGFFRRNISIWEPFKEKAEIVATEAVSHPSFPEAVNYVQRHVDDVLGISVLITKTFVDIFDREGLFLRHLLFVMLGMDIFIFILGCFLAAKMVRPLKILSGAAMKIGAGDFSQHIKVTSSDEIGDLADSFNKMAINLKGKTISVDRLNKEVEAREQIGGDLKKQKEKAEKDAVRIREMLNTARKAEMANVSMLESLMLTKGNLEKQAQELDNSRRAIMNMMDDVREQQQRAEELRNQAEAANKTKSEFLANMSHEIRTPMNSILGFTDLLKATSLDETQKDFAEIISMSGGALLEIINDILDISKIEAGHIKLEKIDFNLEHLVGNIIKLVSPRLEDKPIKLYYDIEQNTPLNLEGDPTRLRQVLINLLGNAAKFTEQGEIILEVKLERKLENDMKLLRFTVKDTGTGIPEDKTEQVFGQFTQVDASTTRKYGGTGLGLSITKSFIELMDGKIWVESELGKGSAFIFTAKFKERPAIVSKDIQPLSRAMLKGKKVLLVDDNKEARVLMRAFCEEFEIIVFEVASSPGALDWLSERVQKKEELPDFALIDIMMPEMGGHQLCRKIKETPSYAKIKLIAASSNATTGVAAEFKESGFDAFLPKPVLRRELISVICTVLGDERDKGQIVTRHMAEELSCKGLKVLVAEDQAFNRKLIKLLLKNCGCEADMVENGQQVIEKLKENKYDLVLMDLMMPVMGGLEAAEVIRRDINKEIPIIALSAAAMKEDQQRAVEAGMNDFLAKPIVAEQLKEKLIKWGKR